MQSGAGQVALKMYYRTSSPRRRVSDKTLLTHAPAAVADAHATPPPPPPEGHWLCLAALDRATK